MKILRLLPGLLVAAAACGSGGGGTEPPPDDGSLFRIESVMVNGQARSYLVFVPGGLPEQNRPLLIALHGQGSAARQMLDQTGLDLLADSLGMVVIFPDALALNWTAQDTTFVRVLVDSLSVRHGTDPTGAHVLGFSQGGTLAMLFACRNAGRVRSIMIHGISMRRESAEGCDPSSPVQAFFLLGTQDILAPWEEDAEALGGQGSARWWAGADGCEAEPGRAEDDLTLRLNWTRCQGGARVRMIAVYGGGHLFFPFEDFNTLGELADWLRPVL